MFDNLFKRPPQPTEQLLDPATDISRYFRIDRANLLRDLAAEIEKRINLEEIKLDFNQSFENKCLVANVWPPIVDSKNNKITFLLILQPRISEAWLVANPTNELLSVLSEDGKLEFSLVYGDYVGRCISNDQKINISPTSLKQPRFTFTATKLC